MSDKEKLTELLDDIGVIVNVPIKVDEDGCGDYSVEGGEYIADILIKSGVILQPCKVGDTVYVISYTRVGNVIYECKIDEISQYSYGTYYYLNWGFYNPRFRACKEDAFGKTVFLTKEEAEKALAERNKL